MSDFDALDLVGIAEGIASRRFSAREVTQCSLQRAETIGRSYNAIFRLDEELALARAQKLDERQARGDSLGMKLLCRDMPVAGAEQDSGQGQTLARRAQARPAQFGRNSL